MSILTPKTTVERFQGRSKKALSLFHTAINMLKDDNVEIETEVAYAESLEKQYREEAASLRNVQKENSRIAAKLEELVA